MASTSSNTGTKRAANRSTASRTATKAKSTPAKGAPKASLDELKHHYREMLLIRRFEEKAGQLYGMGLIGGFCHLYIGQEAVVVGMQAAIEDGDSVVTSYRDHGHMLATGMEARGVMAELTGRIGGYSKGKGGSMHMFSREKNFFGGHGIVAAQVPIGTGLAFVAVRLAVLRLAALFVPVLLLVLAITPPFSRAHMIALMRWMVAGCITAINHHHPVYRRNCRQA